MATVLAIVWNTCAADVPEPKPHGALPTKGQLAWHEIETYCLPCLSIPTFTNEEWAYGDKPASMFNPTNFSADQIVKAARDGGLRGFILVVKHHGGFCLWPTKTTEYSVKNSPWKDGKGDMVREFANACRKHGLAFGIYVSPWDRNHSAYGRPGYVKAFHEQLRELLTNYGPVFEVWFDGAMGGTGYYGGARENRGTQIPVKVDPATGRFADFPNGASSYGEAPHGHRDGKFWMPAEGNFPLRPGWFYHESQDGRVRNPRQLMRTFFLTVGRGGSFNIGLAPDRRGRMHDNDVASLKRFGDWLRETFSQNLAAKAKVTVSNTRGDSRKYGGRNVLDGNRDTYWCSDDAVLTPQLVLDLGEAVEFNVVSLREYLPLDTTIRFSRLSNCRSPSRLGISSSQPCTARTVFR